MAFTVTDVGEAWSDTSGTSAVSTPSFSYAADQVILAFGFARRGTGDPGISLSWSGSPALTIINTYTATVSIGQAKLRIAAAIATASGSGVTVSCASSSTTQNRGVSALKLDGVDISGGTVASIVRQSGQSGTWSPSPLASSLKVATLGFLTSGPPTFATGGTGWTTFDSDYTGVGGSWSLHWRDDGSTEDFTIDGTGGSGPITGRLEIIGSAPPEPEGWPESIIGVHAI